MDITLETPLLGGLSPRLFMRRHWQKKPLLIRQAVPGGMALIARQALFELAAQDEVESRLVEHKSGAWTMRQGPFVRRSIPPPARPGWTLLVQGLDLHLPAAHELLSRFRFAPDARLDDLMISYASDGGGVGPHVDSYDVFLLQVAGRRRWRFGRCKSPELVPGVPLKILANFEPEEEWLLEPGDMLYLPPNWAHDGVAEGECMTASVGFRAPRQEEIGREVLQRLLDGGEPEDDPRRRDPLYRDPQQPAVDEPGRVPTALQSFATDAVQRLLADPLATACALGEVLSEPKPGVWFEAPESIPPVAHLRTEGVQLDRRTRMLYDDHHVFINGDALRAGGRDARMMRVLADRRWLGGRDARTLSDEAMELVEQWAGAGWLHPGVPA